MKIKNKGKNNKNPLTVSRSGTPTAQHELGEGLKKRLKFSNSRNAVPRYIVQINCF